MSTKIFNVKTESLHRFLKENMPDKAISDSGILRDRDCSPYHCLTDTLYLKKSEEWPVGSLVIFHLEDTSRLSGAKLVNVYGYNVQEYDDVCVKLVLGTFDVELVERPKTK